MTRERRKPKKINQFRRKKRRPCFFCVEKKELDYKDINFVKRFITDRGKIAPRRISGCCALHQRMVAKVVKRTRQLGLVPYMVE
ncbi:30S ribosomal protein S18 [Candidatus Saganbacteria bacterium CG08_land_8_20_14_0_20_45_16]|uniref:Small ribosomal subunit protein bS18 n=1 Tax=Candidatus Saganbacteria bacterium CG08_land_8_20_14_0_20_45_16 TaxID=2014293 RepID=A0A2H0Y1P3_UNCSA|nr:MAG: 30S ribosomal protein S18 [Candidatus Saganbacteria bacterium CG08_land_8_20_14_0_20_45_16]